MNCATAAGDTVIVKAGTYTENVGSWPANRASGNPIIVRANPGDTVNLISTYQTEPALGETSTLFDCQVKMNNRSYVRIEGFTFRDSTPSCAIRILQTGGVSGKTSAPVQGIEILNNTFMNMGSPRTATGYMTRQIYMQYAGRDDSYSGGTVNRIEGNTFTANYGAGIDFDNTSDTLVKNNTSTGALGSKNNSNGNWYQANLIQMGGTSSKRNIVEDNTVSSIVR
jgi:parallel beta-helix repeat protein